MKVKNAAQVLSERVSSIVSYLSSKSFIFDKIINLHYTYCINYYYVYTGIKILSEKAADTAKFCLFFYQLFDSVNGNFDKVIDGKIYRTAVKQNSPHHKLWNESLKILSSMYFIDPLTKKRTQHPPTLKNWSKTIKGILNNKYINYNTKFNFTLFQQVFKKFQRYYKKMV